MPGYLVDGEPRDVHPLSCALWTSSNPADDCDCGESFEDGVQRIVALGVVVGRLRLHEATQTTGGPPAPYTHTWKNRALRAGVHPDYRELQ